MAKIATGIISTAPLDIVKDFTIKPYVNQLELNTATVRQVINAQQTSPASTECVDHRYIGVESA